MSEFGRRVKELRSHRGLPQNELAYTLGISPQYLSDIELGRRGPTDDMLQAIAVALDGSSDYLFALAGRLPPDLRDLADVAPANVEAGIQRLREIVRR